MLPGMGRMNPAQMQRMMKQFGVKSEELNAERVVFELEGGKKLVIDAPSVNVVEFSGQKTYTVMGEAKEESAAGAAGAKDEEAAAVAGGAPEEDVKMVAEQAGVSAEKAEKALKKAKGDIAQAIMDLKK